MDAATLADRGRSALRAHPALVDAVSATAFVVAAVVSSTSDSALRAGTPLTDDAVGVALLALATVPYYWRRRSPVAVFVVSSMAVMVLSGLEYQEGATPLIALFGAYTVGARCTSRVVEFTYAYTVLGLTTLYLSDSSHFDLANLVSYTALFAAALLFGWSLQSRATRLQALEERAEAVEREHEEEARRAVSEERLRIAQELHDVVAHSMGVIAVQAGAGLHVIDRDPAEAKRSLEAISGTSRATLTEIRRLLGVLRDEDGAAAYAPAPDADDLEALVAEVVAAGLPTELTVTGDRGELPAGVGLTTYRIVQEALTNVLKHGGPHARATVEVVVRPGAVEVTVEDDGRGVRPGAAEDGDGDGPAAGHGLLGMRERVAVYGGTLDAGPRPSGGFRVRAVLPQGDPATITTTGAEDDAATTTAAEGVAG